MTLKMIEPGRFVLEGAVIFDNASAVEQQGRAQLEQYLTSDIERYEISLLAMEQADSSALSVCLSWLRFARQRKVQLCFTDIPTELYALAKVCGISDLLNNVSCPL